MADLMIMYPRAVILNLLALINSVITESYLSYNRGADRIIAVSPGFIDGFGYPWWFYAHNRQKIHHILNFRC
jgi:hypothetical protein